MRQREPLLVLGLLAMCLGPTYGQMPPPSSFDEPSTPR